MIKARYRQIVRFFGRVMVGVFLWDIVLPKLRLRRLAERTRSRRMTQIAAAFRQLAVEMGGVLIKVGQFLSARVDVLPREITDQLSGLQDEVSVEEFSAIREVIEAEFGMPVEEKFVEFEPRPIASASIGQAHRARIARNGRQRDVTEQVVVKVQRPRIPEIVDADLAAIRVVGAWAYRFRVVRRHANVPRMIDEFSKTLYEEIDYINEGRNAERFAASFKDRSDVVVPRVHWDHTTKRVLTLEDVGAIKIGDYRGIDGAGVDRRAVATLLTEAYLKQIFEDGFFHADPHPGNLFVRPDGDRDPAEAPDGERRRGDHRGFKLVFVDFGMTGQLSRRTNDSLRNLLMAIGTRDVKRLVRAFDDLDFLLPEADRGLLERAARELFEKIWGKSQRELIEMRFEDISEFTSEFGELLYEMPFQIPEDLILFGRCIGILSGMATGLDEKFNLWQSIVPYASKMVEAERGGPGGAALEQVVNVIQALARLPRRFDDFMSFIEAGNLNVRLPEMKDYIARLERGARKLGGAIAFGAILLAGTGLYVTGSRDMAIAFAVADLLLVLWIFFGR